MGRLLREPLLHFLVAGAALFAIYSHLNPGGDDERRIEITPARIELLIGQFEATWHRPPSRDELDAMIQRLVDDEILYREGVALGLADDDPVVRRRVRQKYEVLSEELIAGPAPTEAVLAVYLAANPARFERPARLWFEQVMVATGSAATVSEDELQRVRETLGRGAAAGLVGQPSMLPTRNEDLTHDQVAREFGRAFAARLLEAPVGEWFGPVPSPFGVHLVRIERRAAGGLPRLDEVRAEVASEWERDRRAQALQAGLQKLRSQYEIVIAPTGTSAPAS